MFRTPPRLVRPQGRPEAEAEEEEAEAEEEEAEAEEEEVEEEEEEEVLPNWSRFNQPRPPMEMGNWKARNPPSSPETEPKPTNSCTSSNSTNSSTPMPHS